MTSHTHLDRVREDVDDELVDAARVRHDVLHPEIGEGRFDLEYAVDVLDQHLALEDRDRLRHEIDRPRWHLGDDEELIVCRPQGCEQAYSQNGTEADSRDVQGLPSLDSVRTSSIRRVMWTQQWLTILRSASVSSISTTETGCISLPAGRLADRASSRSAEASADKHMAESGLRISCDVISMKRSCARRSSMASSARCCWNNSMFFFSVMSISAPVSSTMAPLSSTSRDMTAQLQLWAGI